MNVFEEDMPFIESPEPRFGEVIKEINDIVSKSKLANDSIKEQIDTKLEEMNLALEDLITLIPGKLNGHISLEGAVHGETKRSIGLDKKDNFRTATIGECVNFLDVDAFVTPAGARYAALASTTDFDKSIFQSNDVLNLASFVSQKELPTTFSPIKLKLLTPGTNPEMFINSDRILLGVTRTPEVNYGLSNEYFLSNPVLPNSNINLNEFDNVAVKLEESGINSEIGWELDDLGVPVRMTLFNPIADKNLYSYQAGHLNKAGYARAVSLFTGYGGITLKGIHVQTKKLTDTTLVIEKDTLQIDNFELDEALIRVVEQTYPTRLELIGKSPIVLVIGDSHEYDINDFVTLPVGAVITLVDVKPVVATCWKIQDAVLNITYFYKFNVELGNKTQDFLLRFSETLNTANLFTSGLVVIRTSGSLQKAVINTDLKIEGRAEYVNYFDKNDMTNPIENPTIIKVKGKITNSNTNKTSVVLKTAVTGKQDLLNWVESDMEIVLASSGKSEVFYPSRNDPFGSMPERVLLIKNDNTETEYLTFGPNKLGGKKGWDSRKWRAGNEFISPFKEPMQLEVTTGYLVGENYFGFTVADHLQSTPMEVNWGDGVIETVTGLGAGHKYDEPGIYKVSIKGGTNSLNFSLAEAVDLKVLDWGTDVKVNIRLGKYITQVPNTLPSYLTDLSAMFYTASKFNQNINTWNTANVTLMNGLFFSASTFNQPLNNWNVSNVTSMLNMFIMASSFNQPLNNWNVGNVTSMQGMFAEASKFNQNISSWNVGKVTNLLGFLRGAIAFNQPLNDWDVSKVTNFYQSFKEAISFNQPLNLWDVSSATDMYQMFILASKFNQDLSSWCVTKIPTKPTDFDLGATAWVKRRPSWGNCGVTPMIIEVTTSSTLRTLHLESVAHATDPTVTTIDWGDGTSTEVLPGVAIPVKTYSTVGVYQVRIKGNSASLRVLGKNHDADVNTDNGRYLGQTKLTILKVLDWGSDVKVNIILGAYTTQVPTTLPSYVTDLSNMFTYAKDFNQNINGWDTSNVRKMSSVFYNCVKFNQPLNDWDVSNCININDVFPGCHNFNQPLNNWNVSNVTVFNNLFSVTDRFNQDISMWNVSKAVKMNSMFNKSKSFNQDLSSWCVSKIPTKPIRFDGDTPSWTKPKPSWGYCGSSPMVMEVTTDSQASSLQLLSTAHPTDPSSLVIDWGDGTGTEVLPGAAIPRKAYPTPGVYRVTVKGTSDSLRVDLVVTKILDLKVLDWGTDVKTNIRLGTYITQVPTTLPSYLTNLFEMFSGGENFNQPIGSWDTSNVTNMAWIFEVNHIFNQDISSWNTSNVTNMAGAFYGAQNFNKNISNWNTSKVTDMDRTFSIALKFNQPIGSWDVSKVTNMNGMFSNARVFNQPLNNWNVSNVTDMSYIFNNITSFNQDLSGWCVSKIPTKPIGFDYSAPAYNKPRPVWGTCPPRV